MIHHLVYYAVGVCMAAITPWLQLQVGRLQSCTIYAVALVQIRCSQLNSEMHLLLITFWEKWTLFHLYLPSKISRLMKEELCEFFITALKRIKIVKLTSFSPAVSLTLKNTPHYTSHFRIALVLPVTEFQSKSQKAQLVSIEKRTHPSRVLIWVDKL